MGQDKTSEAPRELSMIPMLGLAVLMGASDHGRSGRDKGASSLRFEDDVVLRDTKRSPPDSGSGRKPTLRRSPFEVGLPVSFRLGDSPESVVVPRRFLEPLVVHVLAVCARLDEQVRVLAVDTKRFMENTS